MHLVLVLVNLESNNSLIKINNWSFLTKIYRKKCCIIDSRLFAKTTYMSVFSKDVNELGDGVVAVLLDEAVRPLKESLGGWTLV